VTAFYTDADLTGSGEFAEPTVTLSTRLTVPDGTFNTVRSRFPALAGATVKPRIYSDAGTLLWPATLGTAAPFDTTTNDAWNSATISGGLSVSAGTYRLCQVVTRYVALGGFFSGGSITRGSITGIQGTFDGGDVFPASTSTATYFVDGDFTAGGGSSAVTVIDLASVPMRMARAAEGVASGVLSVDAPGMIRTLNPAAAVALGVNSADSPGLLRALRGSESAAFGVGFADAPSLSRLLVPSAAVLSGLVSSDTPGLLRTLSASASVLSPATAPDSPGTLRILSPSATTAEIAPPVSSLTPIVVPVRRVRAEPRVVRGAFIVQVRKEGNS
jgi:hypothetical protein